MVALKGFSFLSHKYLTSLGSIVPAGLDGLPAAAAKSVMHVELNMKFSLNLLDDEAQEFCEGIVSEMISLFSISEVEAIARVNCQWFHLGGIGGEKELIYHEDENFWAHDIYYGSDSYWWVSDEDRSKRNLPKLIPKEI